MLERILSWALFVLGLGYLLANLRLAIQVTQARRLKPQALLTWPGPRPPFFALHIGMAVTLGLVLLTEMLLLLLGRRRPLPVFGETMMFVYYAWLLPISRLRIGRGFYQDGVWVESGFMRYETIGGLSWREDPQLTLLVIPRMKRLARSLRVPSQYYGAARRLLRDKIADHELHFTGKPLDLGAHDERDDV